MNKAEIQQLASASDQLAYQFFQRKQFNLAQKQTEITCKLLPNANTFFNAAKAAYNNCQYDTALKYIDTALKFEKRLDFLQEKALYHCWLGDFTTAQEMIEKFPDNNRKFFNLAWYKLQQGEFLQGMTLLEKGRSEGLWGNKNTKLPIEKRWNKQQCDSILVVLEGGLGDEIIFVRFVPLLVHYAKNIHLRCSAELVSLFSRLPNVTTVHTWNPKNPPDHDYWITGMSLPSVLQLTSPGSSPYLTVNPNYKIELAGKHKIAFRWQGGNLFEQSQRRTLNPHKMYKCLKNLVPSDTVFYSVQLESDIPCPNGIIDLKPKLRDWETTAAVLSEMDMVFTSCTSVAHLAGALGIPTVVVSPIVSYFLWSCKNTKWYDSVTVFSQTNPYSFDAAIEKASVFIANKLAII